MGTTVTVWLIAGILFIVLELILPGAIAIFLGLGALLVALALSMGLLHGSMEAFTLWFISSMVLMLSLRGFLQKIMPGDTEQHSTDEDADAYGSVVEIVETIQRGQQGRIHFHGTTWPATCFEETLEIGSKAKIVVRDNLVWVVEPLSAYESLVENPSEKKE